MTRLQKGMCLVLGCIFAVLPTAEMTVKAKEPVRIEIGEAQGKEGERICIPISINSSSVAGMDFTVVYDSKELKFDGSKKGKSLNSSGLCDINHIEERSSVRYVYADTEAIDQGGEVLSVYFRVLKDEPKAHTVDVKVKKIMDVDIKDLSYQIEGGRNIIPSEEKDSQQEGADTKTEIKAQGSKKEVRQDMQQEKQRIVIKTEDGRKDITDSIGKKTNENIKEAAQDEKADNRQNIVIIITAVAVICLLSLMGYRIWKRKKK